MRIFCLRVWSITKMDNEKKKIRINIDKSMPLPAILWESMFVLFAAVLLISVIPYHSREERAGNAAAATELTQAMVSVAGDKAVQVTLPYRVSGLAPGTSVKAEFYAETKEDDYIQVRTAFAPLIVEINGEAVWSFGQKERRPAFMKDLGTVIRMVPVGVEGMSKITLIYTAPNTRNYVRIVPVILSNQSGLLRYDAKSMSMALLVAVAVLIAGIILVMISFVVLSVEKKGILFNYIGFYLLFVSLWAIGNSDMTLFILNDPNFLYILSYVGFFTFCIPLGLFLNEAIDFQHFLIFKGLVWIFAAFDVAAIFCS